jgi:hypothetical protein
MASGALGWGVSAGAGWLGVEEHPAINAAARIAKATAIFFVGIGNFLNGLLRRAHFWVAITVLSVRDHCTQPLP